MAVDGARLDEPAVLPVTPDRLADLARFSGANGKFRYCSCQRWRVPSRRFRAIDRAAALADAVRAGTPVGVLAYSAGEPVGWCSIAPRETYAAVLSSRVIPAVEGAEVWSVVCFFVAASARRVGVPAALLQGACDYAFASGASVIEAYPWPGGASYRYMGTRDLYLAAGFTDVPVPAGARPVMRFAGS